MPVPDTRQPSTRSRDPVAKLKKKRDDPARLAHKLEKERERARAEAAARAEQQAEEARQAEKAAAKAKKKEQKRLQQEAGAIATRENVEMCKPICRPRV